MSAMSLLGSVRAMQSSLLLLLLFTFCVVGCLAEDDAGTSITSNSPKVLLELPKDNSNKEVILDISKQEGFHPIRIRVFLHDVYNESMYCSPGDVTTDQRRPNFRGFTAPCYDIDVLTHNKRKTLIFNIIPAAVKMHTDRLQVKPLTGNLTIPPFTEHSCKQFTVPAEHSSHGVSNADYVLYVASGTIISFGLPCAYLSDNMRPVAGVVSISPRDIEANRHAIRLAAHEMAHALGFHWKLLAHLGLGIVRDRKKYITSTAVHTMKEAHVHYNCTTLKELQLEDDTHDGESHWERRHAKNELMTAIMDEVAAYSSLTLSLFLDMGFYLPLRNKSERMKWGENAKCDLFSLDCRTTDASAKFPQMFCKSYEHHKQCTPDRLSVGTCSSNVHTDRCFFVQSKDSLSCIDTSIGAFPGNKRCVERKMSDGKLTDAMCVDMMCSDALKTVKVRFSPNEEYKVCTAGETLKQTDEDKKIVCPKYEEICPLTPLFSGDEIAELLKRLSPKNESKPPR